MTRCTRAVREAGGKKAVRDFFLPDFFRFEAGLQNLLPASTGQSFLDAF